MKVVMNLQKRKMHDIRKKKQRISKGCKRRDTREMRRQKKEGRILLLRNWRVFIMGNERHCIETNKGPWTEPWPSQRRKTKKSPTYRLTVKMSIWSTRSYGKYDYHDRNPRRSGHLWRTDSQSCKQIDRQSFRKERSMVNLSSIKTWSPVSML